MKKLIIIALVTLMLAALAAETVGFVDDTEIVGSIVGKEGNTLYLQTDSGLYALARSEIRAIKNDGGQPITVLIYRKADWMQCDPSLAIEYKRLGPANTIPIDENKSLVDMSEREFYLYLQAREDENTQQICKRLRGVETAIYVSPLIITAAGVVVTLLLAE
jgi:hypothetical protein